MSNKIPFQLSKKQIRNKIKYAKEYEEMSLLREIRRGDGVFLPAKTQAQRENGGRGHNAFGLVSDVVSHINNKFRAMSR